MGTRIIAGSQRKVRKVFLLPNLFTAGSLFCGILAVLEIFNDNYTNACWLILTAAVLDTCDGAIARLTRTTSDFGLNFDSLADLVAFGVAPALLTFGAMTGAHQMLASGVCSLYTICGALRLARFNVQAMREERKHFLGLPVPAAALALIALVFLYEVVPGIARYVSFTTVGPLVLVILAYLMVSKIPYAGLKNFHLLSRQPFEILVALVGVALMLFILKKHLYIVLAVVAWTYILGGVVLFLSKSLKDVPMEHGARERVTADGPDHGEQ